MTARLSLADLPAPARRALDVYRERLSDSATSAPARAQKHDETPLEALSSYCAVIVVGLFILTFIFQNFVILPATMLSGVFYSIHSLPDFWRGLSHANPFFYMIDGFRYGFFGTSDVPPLVSAGVVVASLVGVSFVSLFLLKSGYKLRQ